MRNFWPRRGMQARRRGSVTGRRSGETRRGGCGAPLVAVAILLVVILGIYLRFEKVLLISDRVWRQTVLEDERKQLHHLGTALLNRWMLLETADAVTFEDIAVAVEATQPSVVILSPSLSRYSFSVAERFPEAALIAFENNARAVHITADLSTAMRRAGEEAASYLQDRGGREERFVVLIKTEDEASREYEELFSKGLAEGGFKERVKRVIIKKDTVSVLREEDVKNAAFAWVWGETLAEEVMPHLDQWGVPVCVVGSYAAEAYPETVKVSIRYRWSEALLKAVETARMSASLAKREVFLEGSVEVR